MEELTTLIAREGITVLLRNPFESEQITFLPLWLRAPEPLLLPVSAIERRAVFGQQALGNQLCKLIGHDAETSDRPTSSTSPVPFALSLGRFARRCEAVCQVQHKGSQLFAYVLAGAFELEGRLLPKKLGRPSEIRPRPRPSSKP